MVLNRDLRQFVECLNSNAVEYLIVGAVAVSWHGFARYSADVDFFVRSTPENAAKILAALRQFGFGSLPLELDDFSQPDQIVQLGHEPYRIDIMTSISGVEFDEAWDQRIAAEMEGLPVNVIGLSALLRNKTASGRAKDRIDVDALRELKGE